MPTTVLDRAEHGGQKGTECLGPSMPSIQYAYSVHFLFLLKLSLTSTQTSDNQEKKLCITLKNKTLKVFFFLKIQLVSY